MVLRIALTYTRNMTDAQDIYQETFLRLVKYRHTIESEEHLKAWLIRVTTNCAKSFLSKNQAYNTEELDENISSEEKFEANEKSELYEQVLLLKEKYSKISAGTRAAALILLLHLMNLRKISPKSLKKLKNPKSSFRQTVFFISDKIFQRLLLQISDYLPLSASSVLLRYLKKNTAHIRSTPAAIHITLGISKEYTLLTNELLFCTTRYQPRSSI